MTRTTPDAPESLYAGGAWRQSAGEPIDVIDPADEQVLASVPSATPAEVADALQAAGRAQEAWARTPSVVRGRYLRAMADLLLENKDELARLIVSEVGKPLRQAAEEVGFAAGFLSYSAEWDRRLEGETLPGDVPGEVIQLSHAPLGVVAAICPWNFPLAVLCRKLGPALITGNTVVVKPSEVSPLSTIEFFRLISSRLDLPPGVLSLVTGAAATGQALVENVATAMVTFTGHRDTGKAIMALAARNLTRVALELGGKAPAIVWSDADLDVAVPAIVAARHTNSGQVCTSAERVFVHHDLYEPFLEAYLTTVRNLTLGHPMGTFDLGEPAVRRDLRQPHAGRVDSRPPRWLPGVRHRRGGRQVGPAALHPGQDRLPPLRLKSMPHGWKHHRAGPADQARGIQDLAMKSVVGKPSRPPAAQLISSPGMPSDLRPASP
jgi:lactaldehyde dehydrogenase/glycolaldehyde dehydrogenase